MKTAYRVPIFKGWMEGKSQIIWYDGFAPDCQASYRAGIFRATFYAACERPEIHGYWRYGACNRHWKLQTRRCLLIYGTGHFLEKTTLAIKFEYYIYLRILK